MNDWMHALAAQCGELRRNYPDDRLLVVFDIDGTILDTPRMARDILTMLEGRGITRFSISWKTEAKRQVFEHLDRWGYEVNIYDVADRAVGCTPHRAGSL